MTNTTKKSQNIFEAVANDDRIALERFLEVERVPINNTTAAKRTVAHIAAKKGKLGILEYLIGKDATLVNNEDVYGNTPFCLAIEAGALEVVKYLVDGCKVSASQPFKRLRGNSPVHIAARAGHLEVLKYFVKTKSANVNVVNELGETPSFVAADQSHLHVIKFLVEETDANLALTDKNGDNILFVSARKGDVTIPRYLLDERKLKFDINKRDRLGRSIVYLAAGLDGLDFLKYFVGEKHAKVNLCDFQGKSPLHEAAGSDNFGVIKYLVEQGANTKLKDHDGKMPSEYTVNLRTALYLEKLELDTVERETSSSLEVDHRFRRSLRGSPSQYNILPIFAKIPGKRMGIQRAESQMPVNGQGPISPHRVTSSQIDSFLLLFGVSAKCVKRFGTMRSSLLPREVFENRIDPLATSAISEKH